MNIPRETIDQIRDRTDIVEVVGRYVALRRAGNTFSGLCPFHQEKTASFSVIPHKNIFHCFGCGEGGDVFHFLMKIQGLTFIEVVKELAAAAGVPIEERQLTPEERARVRARANLFDVCEAAATWYQSVLLVRPEGAPGRAYFKKRGITAETIERFRLGYAPLGWTHLQDHLHAQGFPSDLTVRAGLGKRSERGQGVYDVFRGRAIFPILDVRDRVVSFGGRIVEEPQGNPGDDRTSPKYLNGPETEIYEKSKVLFGLSAARNAIQREDRVMVVEGYFDAVSLVQAGFEETVATCGTALTPDHLQVVRRFTRRVVTLFDADEAGLRAAVRAMPLFAQAGMDAVRIQMTEAKDPDEFVQKFGAEAFRARLAQAEPLMELVIRKEATRRGSSPMGRQQTLENLAPLLASFPDAARAALVHRLADVLRLPEEQVVRMVHAVAPAPNTAPPRPPRPTISREIQHLFWLLLHYPAHSSPAVEATHPDIITDRMEIQECLGRLVEGWSLADILEATTDPEIRRLLGEAAARDSLYVADRAEKATRQILARLELPKLEEELARIHLELSTCGTADAGAGLRDLMVRRATLQRRQVALKALLK